jgi:hypothetical protein
MRPTVRGSDSRHAFVTSCFPGRWLVLVPMLSALVGLLGADAAVVSVAGVAAGVLAGALPLVVGDAALFRLGLVLLGAVRVLGGRAVAVGGQTLLPDDAAGRALEHVVDRAPRLGGQGAAQAGGQGAASRGEAFDDLLLPFGQWLVDHVLDRLADVLDARVQSRLVTGLQRCCFPDDDESQPRGVLFRAVVCVLVSHVADGTRGTAAPPGQMGDLLLEIRAGTGMTTTSTNPQVQRVRRQVVLVRRRDEHDPAMLGDRGDGLVHALP